MPAAAKEETLASPMVRNGAKIFFLAAGVDVAALEPHQGANAARGKKPHQGIFSKNRTIASGATWAKWPGTHQDSRRSWSKTVLGIVIDANGNTLTDPSGKGYAWDFENRLVQAVVPSSGSVIFKYDPFGRRIQKSGPAGTTSYLYDGLNLIEEVDSIGNVLARYTQTEKIDEPLSALRSGSSYFEADGLGSVTSLSNTAGTLANTYTYDSFGKLTGSTGTLTNPFQYTGREFDPETGIYEYRYRYYDQSAGRFVSEDPIHFRGGIDFYEYVFNNPLLWTDPRGLEVQMCTKYWHPHTFICVDGDCSGKYPSSNPFNSPDDIRDDSSNKPKAHCNNVPNNTPCFEQCVAKRIKNRGPSGDLYNFIFANCGQWAEDVVTECRIKCSK